MKTIATLALGTCMTLAFAGAGFAQSNMMSDSDKAMMTKCKAMTKSDMEKNKDCMAMMKKEQDMKANVKTK